MEDAIGSIREQMDQPSDSQRMTQGTDSDGREVIRGSSIKSTKTSLSWDADTDEEDFPRISGLRVSSPSAYRHVLAFQPPSSSFSFRRPEGVRMQDGVRLVDVPIECRPQKSIIKSKMLKHAHDALYSIGMFTERFGSAIAEAVRQGDDRRRLSAFLLADLVGPVSRLAADACHIISLYTGEQQERDLASYGLVLSSPKEGAAAAPIAQQLLELRKQAAERGVKEAAVRTASLMSQHMRGGDRGADSGTSSPKTWEQRQRRPVSRPSSATESEVVPRFRRGARRFVGGGRAAPAVGVAGGGRQVPAASRDAGASADA